MNTNLSSFWQWLTSLPLWLRSVVLALIAGLVLIYSLSSCGATRAIVHNGAHGTSTEIKITTNNPTSVTASPNVSVNP